VYHRNKSMLEKAFFSGNFAEVSSTSATAKKDNREGFEKTNAYDMAARERKDFGGQGMVNHFRSMNSAQNNVNVHIRKSFEIRKKKIR